jgi:DNA-binding protein H-NS
MNLESYTIDELEKLIRQAEAALDKKRKAELKNAQSVLEKMAKELGVDPSALLKPADKKPGRKKGAAKKKASTRKPVKPKYRDPSNAKNTWSGRGKRPIWLQQALEKGSKLEDFAI